MKIIGQCFCFAILVFGVVKCSMYQADTQKEIEALKHQDKMEETKRMQIMKDLADTVLKK